MVDNLFVEVELGVSDFVVLVNQTLAYAYQTVSIKGELANLKVSKGKWIYFDLKDADASVHFFGTVYSLPGPLEDGMMLVVRGMPRLHPRYGFSVNVAHIRPSGEGTLRRSAELLRDKLSVEGLFDVARKRLLPYAPTRVGLITSSESAAYADFVKVVNARWAGMEIECIDVQVQGDVAPGQIVEAIEVFNSQMQPPEVLVLIRGGGSPEDLYAYSTESVTRAVAASRVPTLVAIGHEVDLSLAELAADLRASTPSNAAELLVPDKAHAAKELAELLDHMRRAVDQQVHIQWSDIVQMQITLESAISNKVVRATAQIYATRQLLEALDPRSVMKRGYAIVRRLDKRVLKSVSGVMHNDTVNIELYDGHLHVRVEQIMRRKGNHEKT